MKSKRQRQELLLLLKLKDTVAKMRETAQSNPSVCQDRDFCVLGRMAQEISELVKLWIGLDDDNFWSQAPHVEKDIDYLANEVASLYGERTMH
jgi:hypothetical protein